MPHDAPLQGSGQLIQNVGQALSSTPLSPDITNFLANVNTLINAMIGLVISLVIVLFFLYLIRWIISGDTERGRAAAKGATRAFIALFLMVDVWFLIRLLQLFEDISPATAYALVIVSFLIVGCWSLLGIGQMLLDALSGAVNWIVAFAIHLLRHEPSAVAAIRYLQNLSDAALRLIVLALIIIPITVYVVFWSYQLPSDAAQQSSGPTHEVYADPLIRESGDASLTGNTYENKRYGISITYPKGWKLFEADASSSNSLSESQNDEFRVHAYLNAGIFPDLTDGTKNDYLTALWRIEKYIHSSYAANSVGILSSQTAPAEDIASTTATEIRFTSFWRRPDQSIATLYNYYFIFGRGPVYFTLEFVTDNEKITEGELTPALMSIVRSIQITEPKLTR